VRVETARGDMNWYVVSDGSEFPYRVHIHTGSFAAMSIIEAISRGLMIAGNAPTLFARLLSGAITLTFFTYAFVNMGMVTGILPVVGVPLPLVSYGGTSLVTICLGIGILMSVHTHRKLVPT